MLQIELFQYFWSFFAQKMTKRRERFRSTVALPVLFCDLGRCTKAGARACQKPLYLVQNRAGPAVMLQNEPFQELSKKKDTTAENRVRFYYVIETPDIITDPLSGVRSGGARIVTDGCWHGTP